MDLDHVCTVHKRWFRNLRIVNQSPNYVEYRLTSRFYGLRQEITARGAPIDEDRYWYEFLTAVAQMRVEGVLDGKTDISRKQKKSPTASIGCCYQSFCYSSRSSRNKKKTSCAMTRRCWSANTICSNRVSKESK